MFRSRSHILSFAVFSWSFLGAGSASAQGLCKFSEWPEPVNLGPPVNSEFDDTHPAISSNGLSLYFTSTRLGFGGEDLWVSRRASLEDPWSEPENLGPNINTESNDLAPALSPDGHWLLFASNRPGGCGVVLTDLYASYRKDPTDDLGWELAVNLGCIINTPANESGPSYHEDPATGAVTLYFARNHGVGDLDFDIYVSTLKDDGSWGPGVLLNELSSPSLDSGPSIRRDGLELFIASNRPGSIDGRLDLWVSTRETTLDPWSEPVNLGPTVNSASVDHGPELSFDGTTLYFDSDRLGGCGGRDIYVTTRQKMEE